MNIFASFKVALVALQTNALRSILTMLGIIIGVGAVITMVSMGSGAEKQVSERLQSLGSNLLMVTPGSSRQGGRRLGGGTGTELKEADAAAIARTVPGIELVAPEVRGAAQLVLGNLNWSSSIRGVTPEYLDARDWELEEGRFIEDGEVRTASKVAVIGSTIREELFGESLAVGETVRMNKVPILIVGVLKAKGQSAFGSDQDDIVMLPLSTAKKRIIGQNRGSPDAVQMITVKVGQGVDMQAVMDEITALLRIRHHIAEGALDTFSIRNLQEMQEAGQEATQIFAILLAAIASVSLLVGGIGIMNIMLVSVTERTREIGLRMALGAKQRDILSQFLVEAVTLCLIGGLIGITLGAGGAILVSNLAGWPTLIRIDMAVMAFVVSGLIGIFFGFYPARKAARLNPIDALRFE